MYSSISVFPDNRMPPGVTRTALSSYRETIASTSPELPAFALIVASSFAKNSVQQSLTPVSRDSRLVDAVRAHQAVCGLLDSSALSEQTVRQLENLRKLLELEIESLRDNGQSED